MSSFFNFLKAKFHPPIDDSKSWYICTWYISTSTHLAFKKEHKMCSARFDSAIDLSKAIFANAADLAAAPNGRIGYFLHPAGFIAEVKKYPKYLYRYK